VTIIRRAESEQTGEAVAMADEDGKKRSKKGLFAFLLAAGAAVTMVLKRRKRGAEDAGWEEAKPEA
jgi:hypothetical protein